MIFANVEMFQDTPLHHNSAEGVILTNRSLVLQGIDRTRSGGYTCQALNAVGSGQSQNIKLDVKCKMSDKQLQMLCQTPRHYWDFMTRCPHFAGS